MPLVVAYDEIPPEKIRRNAGGPDRPASTNYPFFRSTAEAPGPSAFLAQYPPGDTSSTHFHMADQFQILVQGRGTMGRHPVEPYSIHFSRAWTPYGPLHADERVGWTFMTLRSRFDPGAQRLPGALPKLQAATDRRPWQITSTPQFPPRSASATFQEIPAIRDDEGLYACAFTVAPGVSATAPAPSNGDGQYIVVVKGSLVHEGRERKALTVVFSRPDEPSFRIQAGPGGLEGLILNFPRVTSAAPQAGDAAAAPGTRKWRCVLCNFTYDEAQGLPDEGIAPGTPWDAVPDSWTCPDCGASKADFDMELVA